MSGNRLVAKVLMFVDLHHFSIATVKLGDRTAEFIQAFYVLVGDIVVNGGGQLIKYIGDAVFAVFDIGNEIQAVTAAIRFRELFADLARLFEVDDITDAEVGIGSGIVEFGTFGHSSLRCIDACGEAVNETAVIMHHRGVAITKSVYDAISGVYECRSLPDYKAKWRDDPIERWEVVGPA